MNRHQRRNATRQQRYASSEDCPCCNVKAIALQCLKHNEKLRSFDGQPVAYPVGPQDDMAIYDFGILTIMQTLPPNTETCVKAFGEVVMMMTPDDFHIEREGPWIGTLANIRRMLDAQFGPVSLSAGHLH